MDNITAPVIMEYCEISKGKFNGVKHYQLTNAKNGLTVFSDKINISKDRQFSKSKAKYWLKKWEGNKWSCCLTGLFSTSNGLVYYGDTQYKKNVVIFVFSELRESVTIYFFTNYYPKDMMDFIKKTFIRIIKKRGGL